MEWQTLLISLAKLFVFAVFITAILEVIKTIAFNGLFTMIKELAKGLWRNSPLSSDSVKVLNFVIALFYCKVFQYGVMQEVLGLKFGEFPLAYFLDYIGTSAVIFMGAGWAYDQFMQVKNKFESGTSVKTSEEKTTETTKTSTETK